MTQNKRIFLNILATYGRSLYALILGLFTARWALMVLGESDYGLNGVVGGLTAFVTFLNGIMASGVGRFYAVSVGAAQKDSVNGLEKCREWFTTAVVIHTILPVLLILIGYPIGEWAVRHFLTIPPDCIEDCVLVWRFSCIACFVAMVSVPYNAMYGAKQEIAELTIYSFITSTLNVFFLYYALNHPGKWLVRFSAWGCFLSVGPSMIITWRSLLKYEECRFRWRYLRCWKRIREMFVYCGWLMFGNLADLLSGQGMNVLVNKYFGPKMNASMAIGNAMSAHCTTLSGSLLGAFWPAVMNAYGAGQYDRMRRLSYQACKFAPLLIMFFAIPLSLEIDEVLILWLKNPPSCSAGICILSLIVLVVDRSTHGFAMAMHSAGDIAKYQIVVGGVYLFALPLALLFFELNCSVYYFGVAILITRGLCSFFRIVMARRKTGMSMCYWLKQVAFPLLGIAALTISAGIIPRLYMAPSPFRVVCTAFCCVTVMSVSSWFGLLETFEREFVWVRIRSKLLARG